MKSSPILPERIRALRAFYRSNGRMPSFAELGKLIGLRSKHAVWKLVGRLEEAGIVARDATGRLLPGSRMGMLKVLGTVEAGIPGPAEEISLDSLSLDHWLVRDREETFLLKVAGDSMIEAGILEDDLVIVDRNRSAKSGDIVVAEVDGGWTLKVLQKQGERIMLIPANARYQPIVPVNELRIAGVVTAVIRSYGNAHR